MLISLICPFVFGICKKTGFGHKGIFSSVGRSSQNFSERLVELVIDLCKKSVKGYVYKLYCSSSKVRRSVKTLMCVCCSSY